MLARNVVLGGRGGVSVSCYIRQRSENEGGIQWRYAASLQMGRRGAPRSVGVRLYEGGKETSFLRDYDTEGAKEEKCGP